MASLFNKGFQGAKCKTLLKLTVPRIKLLRNRREIQVKQMRREIAKLLETGQEATARIRVEHIIREEKMMAAQEIVELFVELIAVRIPIIEAQRECPLDLKEAISSVCFAAPRCADLPELLQVQMLFSAKYGKDFVSSATELRPECGVNRQLIELLSIQAPAPDVKLKLLKEIAEENELEWDPSASESELLKTHEDLLNGPKKPANDSKLLIPQHVEAKIATSEPPANENSDSDEDFDIIDFPEVPRQPLQSNKRTVSAPGMLPFPTSALSDVDDQEEPNPSGGNENLSHTLTKEDASKGSAGLKEEEQFVPFMRPPSLSMGTVPARQHSSLHSIQKTEGDNMDLQDVLAAAQTAADSAERAAAAARLAANLAQLLITELVKKKNNEDSSSHDDNPFHIDKPNPDSEEEDELHVHPLHDDRRGHFDSSSHSNSGIGHGSLHRPQRLPSMDEETYFSYPNLFTSQGSSRVQSFKDSK